MVTAEGAEGAVLIETAAALAVELTNNVNRGRDNTPLPRFMHRNPIIWYNKTMKRTLTIFLVMAVGVIGLFGQGKSFKYYNLDRVSTVKGTIVAIDTQQSYHKHEFITIELSVPKSGANVTIEVCPQWFFQLDLLNGMEIEATGSIVETQGKTILMSRSLRYGGEIHYFRDENGFPLWRGRRKSRNQGRGEQRRRQGRQQGRR